MRPVFNQVPDFNLNEVAVLFIGRIVLGPKTIFVEEMSVFCADLKFGDGEFVGCAFSKPDIGFLTA